ncbi:MAG: T9SS type A sorting domain-containing protein [Chitinophagaceae bacterium]|nr:MAG: T9SS type A sorting domain-containing protein [Chitinophagaceae bacterium]
MKKICLLFLLAFFGCLANAQYTTGWNKAMNFGGAGVTVTDLRYAANGDLYLLASVMGKYQFASVNYDAGKSGSFPTYDLIYGKITSAGTQVLIRRFAQYNTTTGLAEGRLAPDGSLLIFKSGTGTAVDFGNGVVSRVWGLDLLKINTTGTTEWIKPVNTGADVPYGNSGIANAGIRAMQVNGPGNIYAIILANNKRGNIYPTRVIKFNGSGNEVWHYEMTAANGAASNQGILFNDLPKQFVDDEGNATFVTGTTDAMLFNGETLPYEVPYQFGGFGNWKNWLVSIDNNGNKKFAHSAYIIPSLLGVHPQTGEIFLDYKYQKQQPATAPVLAPFSSLPNIAPPPPFDYIPEVYAWHGIITFDKGGNITKTKVDYPLDTYLPKLEIGSNGRMLLYGKTINDQKLVAGNNFVYSPTVISAAMEVDANFTPLTVFRTPEVTAVAIGDNKLSIGANFKAPVTFGSTTLTPYHIDTDYDTRFPNWVSIKADILIAEANLDNIPTTLSSSTWLGNTTNWNDATNWSNGIPTAETKVLFTGTPANMPTTATSPVAGQIIVSTGAEVTFPSTLKVTDKIENNGKIILPSTGALSFSGFSAKEITGSGVLAFTGGNATYAFTKETSNTVSFEKTLYLSAAVKGLQFASTTAKISGSPIVTSSDENAITGYSSTAFIDGKLTRAIKPTATYVFPVGNYQGYAPVTIQTTGFSGTTSLTIETKTNDAPSPNLTLGGVTVNKALDNGYWIITPNNAPTAGTYKITVEQASYDNGVTDAARYVLLKRSSAQMPWAFEGSNEASTQTGGTINGTVVKNGKITATLTGLRSFSDFAIGIGETAIPVGLSVTTSTWTGAANTVWNNAANWSNGVPSGTVDAVIPAGLTNYPLTYNEATDNAKSLTVHAGVNMKLNSNLKLSSGLLNNGTVEIFNVSTSNEFLTYGGGISGTGKLVFTSSANLVKIKGGMVTNNVDIDITNAKGINLIGKFSGNINVISGMVTAVDYGGQWLESTNPTATMQITAPVNHISGRIYKSVNTTGTYFFPVGDEKYFQTGVRKYAPITITNNNISAPAVYNVWFDSQGTDADPAIVDDNAPITAKLNSGVWKIFPSVNATGGTVDVTMQTTGYTNGKPSVNEYVLLRKKYNSGAWMKVEGATFTETSGTITVTVNGIAPFSYETVFCIGLKGATTTWTGATNANWNTASNWTNGVPTNTMKALFTPVTVYPSSYSNAALLEVQSGVKLTLPQSYYAPMGIINNGSIEISGSGIFYGFGSGTSYAAISGRGKLIFGNNSPGTFDSYYTAATLANSLEINKAGGITVTRTTSLFGSLSLVNGIVTMGASQTLSITDSSATATGNVGSYVVGNLRAKVQSSGSYTFPVGTASVYAPAMITVSAITGTKTIETRFTADAVSGMPNLTIGNATVTELLSAGTWTITPDVALTGGSYAISLSGPKGNANGAGFVVLKRQSNNSFYPWTAPGNSQTATTTDGVVTATTTGLTSFSQFAIGVVPASALPVTLSHFSVKVRNNQALLLWQTASEQNNKLFVVERSRDGQVFTAIGEVKGQGNTALLSSYNFIDAKPLNGTSYYRLKQVDFDGNVAYSATRMINFTTAQDRITVYPNPAQLVLNIGGIDGGTYPVQLFNAAGVPVFTGAIAGGKVNLPQGLAAGMYILSFTYNGERIDKPVTVYK